MKFELTAKIATSLLVFPLLVAQPSTTRAQGTVFTYQGRLLDGGSQATGNYDLTFTLFNDPVTGTQIGTIWTNLNVAVSNGLFTAAVNFGPGVFDGTAYWLALGIRTNTSATTFASLTPRQPITPSPYAIRAVTAGSAGAVAATNIVGTLPAGQLPATVVTNGASGLTLAGTFTGDGSGLTNVPVTSSQITGTLPLSQLPAAVVTNGASGLTMAGTFTGNGTGLTNLNATNLVSGKVADARLSANVALLSGTNSFAGVLLATNSNNQITGTFTGDGSGVTNLNLLNVTGPLRYRTNAFTGPVNFTNAISGITTTNNITITNCLGGDDNYFDSCLIVFRNSSSNVVTVTLSAAFKNMDTTGNTLYLTNVGQLLVWRYTGFDTNFYWKGR